MKLQIIVILLVSIVVTVGLSQIGNEQIFITVTSEGKAKISQSLFPETFVSTIDVKIISENISNMLAIDEENILLGTSQNQELLKIATLGASSVNLKYNADILSYESGVFKLKYNSELESRVNLPPLSKLVSLNTIPIEITDEEYVLPPGDITLSFTIRPVTSNEFFVPVGDSEYKVETITAAKIEEFSANSDEIQFIIKDKAIVLTIIPTMVMSNPNDASLNGEKVDFTQFHKNSTHSWIRIDPHEKGLVKILDSTEKTEEGGGCLIATATYGSEMAPQVQFLREIRDNQLMNTNSGASFMSGFNSLYYSFSPHVADMERSNPIFKEIVKIVITPLLSSLSVMEYAETDDEILGLGISVILMNIGMYFVLPFVICYQGMRLMRTRRLKVSNWAVISNCNVRSVLKIGLFGLIALFVLTVSVPSAFAQTVDSESESPLRMVLDITYDNIVESITNSGLEQDEIDLRLATVTSEYDDAVDLINGDDVVAAKQDVVQTMAIFELIAEDIAEANPTPSQLTPGFGAGIDSASDTGITQGQGLGVGGVPPGIFNQITAANTFEIQEQITEIDNEIEGLQNLIESSNLPVNLEKVNESINLAKEVLMSGDIPNAQAKLAVAKEIKDDLYGQINEAVKNNEDVRIQQFVDNSINNINEMLEKDNLGLTKKAIDELESTLAVLESGDINEILDKTDDNSEFAKEVKSTEDPGNSENAPGQDESGPGNSENAPGQDESGPGNSENAPGQDESGPGNSENAPGQDESGPGNSENAPGQDESGPGNSENAPGQDESGPGNSENAPGQLKKFNNYASSFEQSADDFYENSYEAQIDDVFEANFDGTNKGNGDGKGKFGAFPGKSGEAPGQIKSRVHEDKKGQNANFGNCGIPGQSPTQGPEIVLLGDDPLFISISGTYVEAGAEVCDNIDDDQIPDTVGSLVIDDTNVNTSIAGLYSVTYTATDSDDNITVVSRDVVVGDDPIFEVLDMNGNIQTSDFDTQVDISPPDNDDTYNLGIIQNVFDEQNTVNVINDISSIDGTVPAVNTYTVTYTVTDDNTNSVTITETVTVCDGGCATEPDQVIVFTATAISDTQINLDWDAPANGGSPITGYQIERRGETGPFNDITPDTWGTNTVHLDIGLDADTEYDYRITAINGVGTSPVSSIISETTLTGGGGGPTVPGVPTNVGGSATGSTSIDIFWTAPGNNGGDTITGYKIERKISGGTWELVELDTSPNDATTYSDLGPLTPNKNYQYKISAINSIGTGAESDPSSNIKTDK